VEEHGQPDLDPAHVWVSPVEENEDQRSAAHALLLALTRSLGGEGELRHEESGRPVVEGLAVSLSHARGLVAVAANRRGPVGVDLESRREFEIDGMARRWFDAVELTWLRAQTDQVEAFLWLWTAKEAVGKALGRGLRGSGLRRVMPLDGTTAVPSEPRLAVLRLPLQADAVLAIAVPVTTSEVRLTEHHGAALRSTVTSRTSFPVVVRGN
jgi:4'-phosphopantetheinyl transferase